MIDRRHFLGGLAATAGVAAGCGPRSTPSNAGQSTAAPAGTTPASAQTDPPLIRATSIKSLPFTQGTGLFLTFEGLCAIALPASGQPLRVGLLTGHDHLATLVLHRSIVHASDKWNPVASDDDHYYYSLTGLLLKVNSPQTPGLQVSYKKVVTDCAANDADWENVGWALDMKEDLSAAGALKDEWWKQSSLVDAAFELDQGWLEGGFAQTDPMKFDRDAVKWQMPNGTKRVLKQIVRFRLQVDKLKLMATTLAGTDPRSITLKPGYLAYAAVKHFPLGPKKNRLPVGEKLHEAAAYYALFRTSPGSDVPIALDKGEDCVIQATPDCSCCPPGVFSA